MYNGYKVKIFIFAGREATMRLLMPQLNDPIIDEIVIAKNTNNASDLAWLSTLKNKYTKVTYIELPISVKNNPHGAWKYLYKFMQDSGVIYIKMDDDVVFIKPGYISNTVKFKVDHPEYLCVFPVIVNNPYVCTLLKVHPMMFGTNLTKWQMMNAYFYNGDLGAALHTQFLTKPTNLWEIDNHEFGPEAVQWKYNTHEHLVSNMVAWDYAERMGINAMCYIGDDFKQLDVADRIHSCYSDELFLMYNVFDYAPDKKHCIVGTDLVCHWAFSGQTSLRDRKDLLKMYQVLVEKTYQVKI